MMRRVCCARQRWSFRLTSCAPYVEGRVHAARSLDEIGQCEAIRETLIFAFLDFCEFAVCLGLCSVRRAVDGEDGI